MKVYSFRRWIEAYALLGKDIDLEPMSLWDEVVIKNASWQRKANKLQRDINLAFKGLMPPGRKI